MNEHVYKYYRWQGWMNEKLGRLFASFFCYEFAKQEREWQINNGFINPHPNHSR